MHPDYNVVIGFAIVLLPPDRPQYFISDRGRGFDFPASLAMWAGPEQLIFQTLAGSLPGHLHQPELGNFQNIGAHLVSFERLLERVVDLLSVRFLLHIDEIDNDDTADISQAQLTHDFLGSLEVGFENRFFLISFP